MEDKYMFMFEQLIKRQNAILDMLSSFIQVYAKDNNHAIECVEQESEYVNDIEEFDR